MSNTSSPYEAAVDVVVAEAEALAAFSAAVHDLARLGLTGSARVLEIFEKNALHHDQQIRWAWVSDLVSSVLRVYQCAMKDDPRHVQARVILTSLRDSTDRAWGAHFRASQSRGEGGSR